MLGGSAVTAVVAWLRAGYPEGVPHRDYLPLFALLSRRLTPDEVLTVATTLSGSSDAATRQAIIDLIESLTHRTALDSDISRVTAQLGDPDQPGHPPPGHGHGSG
jgi:hypothetical protein